MAVSSKAALKQIPEPTKILEENWLCVRESCSFANYELLEEAEKVEGVEKDGVPAS